MDEPSILVLRPGELQAKDRSALRKIGVVVVEVDNPADVRFMRPSAELSSTDMLYAAVLAISTGGSSTTKGYFTDEIAKILLARREPTPNPVL